MPKPDLKTKSRDERIAEIAEIMGVPASKLEHHIKDLHDVWWFKYRLRSDWLRTEPHG